MINVKNPRWGGYPGLSEWIQSNHVALKVEDYRKTVSEKCNMRRPWLAILFLQMEGNLKILGEKADSGPGAQKVQGESENKILHQKIRKYEKNDK